MLKFKIPLPENEPFPLSTGGVVVATGDRPHAMLSFDSSEATPGRPKILTSLSIWDRAGRHYVRRFDLSVAEFWEETFLEPVWYTPEPHDYVRSQAQGRDKGASAVQAIDTVTTLEFCGRRCMRAWVVGNIDLHYDGIITEWTDTGLLFKQKKLSFDFEAIAQVGSNGECLKIYSIFSGILGMSCGFTGPIVSEVSTRRRFLLGHGLFERARQEPPNDDMKCFEHLAYRRDSKPQRG